MPNKNIFCNVPWYQGHVFWDGTYGHCCFANKDTTHGYNVKTHSIQQWIESDSMVNFKRELLGDTKSDRCHGCYLEEEQGHISKRQNENLKSAIWSTEFDRSFKESPTRDKFLNLHPSLYKEWHLDFGNECNLACKMCNPNASSKIETLYRRWGMPVDYTSKRIWVNDTNADKFIKQICETQDLKRIHIMGGEPLIQPKFKKFVNTLSNQRPDISFSFVTNGTCYDNNIIEDLLKFESVEVELSIETVDPVNDYIRQGSNIVDVTRVIRLWNQHKSQKFGIVLRPTPSILSVSRYKNLLEYAYKNKHIIRSVLLSDPFYLRISLLPLEYRKSIIDDLQAWSSKIQINTNEIVGTRDQTRWEASLKLECESMITCLQQEHKPGLERELVEWLTRWDNTYKLNVLDYLPEFRDFFTKHGYQIPN